MSSEDTPMVHDVARADVCAVAVAEIFRGDGEIMASPMGTLPAIGARLAKATFEPDLVLTDGLATIIEGVVPLGAEKTATAEGWMPFRRVFDTLWWGKRHVLMGATQIDPFGNQNISCIGDWAKPKVQLLGMRGAPGNTICHPTSYWVPKHSKRVFVPKVDVVSGIGWDKAKELGEVAARFFEIRRVVTDLAVLDFESSDRRMRLRSVHPGVTVDQVVAATGFELVIPDEVPETRRPTDEERGWIARIDPAGKRHKEVPDPLYSELRKTREVTS